MFENCKQAGVNTYENTRVTAVTLGDDGAVVSSVNQTGQQQLWQPRFVIDASGRDAFLVKNRGVIRKNQKHASAAVFGHFKGVERRPGKDVGNISVYCHPNGWLWMIPLKDDVMSIGAMCWPDYLKIRNCDTAEFLLQTINKCPAVSKRMSSTTLSSTVRVAANYSYGSSQCWGDGFISIGDAYTFIDPVFSSRVYLAMNGAEQAIAPIEKWLLGERVAYRRGCKAFVKSSNRGLAGFSWFIYRFTSPAMQNLFRNPRNIFQVEDAVISMLSGDMFGNRKVNRRLLIFKFIYYVSWLVNLKQSIHSRRRRLSVAKIGADDSLEIV